MKTSLCTCGHLPHIFACWGDNGECACREHAEVRLVPGTIYGHNYGPLPNLAVGWLPGVNVPVQKVDEPDLRNSSFTITRQYVTLPDRFHCSMGSMAQHAFGPWVRCSDYIAAFESLPTPCGAQNGDSDFFCNLPKGHAADHQSVNLNGRGGAVGWSHRR